MGLFPDTRFDDWTRRDVGSFAKRYFEPLWRVALLDFSALDVSAAQDLAQAFLVRELERTPIFERYEPSRGHDAKFRTYLRTCFYRFCRDELRKEGRHDARSLDALPQEPPAEGTPELDRLVARDLLRSLRRRVLEGGRAPLPPEAERYFALKWPDEIHEAPRADAEVSRLLGLTRAKLRTVKRKVVERVLLAIRNQLHEEGLGPDEVDRALAGYVAALGREDAPDAPGDGERAEAERPGAERAPEGAPSGAAAGGGSAAGGGEQDLAQAGGGSAAGGHEQDLAQRGPAFPRERAERATEGVRPAFPRERAERATENA